MKTNRDCSQVMGAVAGSSVTEGARRQHFLVPIDFSEPSVRALRHAQRLAADGKAEIVLLNVIEEPLSFRTLDSVQQEREQINQRRAQLESLALREAQADVPMLAIVCDGSPAEAISRVAASSHSDMIIVGRHEHGGLGDWFHRRTVNRLVRRAPCPVMVLGS